MCFAISLKVRGTPPAASNDGNESLAEVPVNLGHLRDSTQQKQQQTPNQHIPSSAVHAVLVLLLPQRPSGNSSRNLSATPTPSRLSDEAVTRLILVSTASPLDLC